MHTLGSNLNVQNNSEAMCFCLLEQLKRANSISAQCGQGTVGKQVLFSHCQDEEGMSMTLSPPNSSQMVYSSTLIGVKCNLASTWCLL